VPVRRVGAFLKGERSRLAWFLFGWVCLAIAFAVAHSIFLPNLGGLVPGTVGGLLVLVSVLRRNRDFRELSEGQQDRCRQVELTGIPTGDPASTW